MSATDGAVPIRSKEPGTPFQVSHKGVVSLGFGLLLTTFPRHKEGPGCEVELLGLEPAPIWDPSAFKVTTLAARPWRRAPNIFFKGGN